MYANVYPICMYKKEHECEHPYMNSDFFSPLALLAIYFIDPLYLANIIIEWKEEERGGLSL